MFIYLLFIFLVKLLVAFVLIIFLLEHRHKGLFNWPIEICRGKNPVINYLALMKDVRKCLTWETDSTEVRSRCKLIRTVGLYNNNIDQTVFVSHVHVYSRNLVGKVTRFPTVCTQNHSLCGERFIWHITALYTYLWNWKTLLVAMILHNALFYTAHRNSRIFQNECEAMKRRSIWFVFSY